MYKRKLLSICLSICILSTLAACNPFQKEKPSQAQTEQENNVEFEIEDETNPEFSTDVSDIEMDTITSDSPIYEEENGYAYELDPNTLERISGPLDPVTYEPVESTSNESDNPLAPDTQVQEPQVEESTQVEQETVSGTTTPNSYNKLPNTGLYPEE